MQNLIQFFVRFAAFFLFLILEIICFVLIVRNNDTQRDIFLNSSNIISAKTNQWYDQMVEYSSLQETADSLAAENARLKTALYNSRNFQLMQKSTVQDTFLQQEYHTISASIINNSITSRNNVITLDRGFEDGIHAGMGVIGDKGLVGIVKHSSPSFSSAISLLHSSTRISTAFKNQNYFGSLVWKGFNPTRMSLEAVPKHANIHVGDTLQTSGYSHIFPKGIVVGTVDTFWIDRGSNFYSIDVALVNDLSQTNMVYVVQNLKKLEQDSLENLMINE